LKLKSEILKDKNGKTISIEDLHIMKLVKLYGRTSRTKMSNGLFIRHLSMMKMVTALRPSNIQTTMKFR